MRLRYLGLLLFNWKDKAFEFIESNDLGILKTTDMEEADRDDLDGTWYKVGPATRGSLFKVVSVTTDRVAAIWCPKQGGGQIAKESMDGRRLPSFKRLCSMDVMLYMQNTLLAEMMNTNAGCHFQLPKLFCFRAGLQFSRLSIICSDSLLKEN